MVTLPPFGLVQVVVCAACGDGRAACRVRPAMLMPGHGERLAVAIVAVARYWTINVVLVAAVFGQIADGERLALPAGMRRSINIAEFRGPVVALIRQTAPTSSSR